MKRILEGGVGCMILAIVLMILAFIGEVMCVVKFVRSDFKAPYTREVVYGVGAVTGLGAIVGYINIKD